MKLEIRANFKKRPNIVDTQQTLQKLPEKGRTFGSGGWGKDVSEVFKESNS